MLRSGGDFLEFMMRGPGSRLHFYGASIQCGGKTGGVVGRIRGIVGGLVPGRRKACGTEAQAGGAC